MWRSSSSRLFFRTLLGGPAKSTACRWAEHPIRRPWLHLSSSSSTSASSTAPPSAPSSTAAWAVDNGISGGATAPPPDAITFAEAKRLMRLGNVEALKRKLETDGEEVIGYSRLLEACEGMGMARTPEEAIAFVRVLEEAGVILLFGDKVYLHPDKVEKVAPMKVALKEWRVTDAPGYGTDFVKKPSPGIAPVETL